MRCSTLSMQTEQWCIKVELPHTYLCSFCIMAEGSIKPLSLPLQFCKALQTVSFSCGILLSMEGTKSHWQPIFNFLYFLSLSSHWVGSRPPVNTADNLSYFLQPLEQLWRVARACGIAWEVSLGFAEAAGKLVKTTFPAGNPHWFFIPSENWRSPFTLVRASLDPTHYKRKLEK